MYSTEKLKVLRKKKHYTIYQMAEKLGITASFYSQIENKKRRLFYDMACDIAKIFDLKADDIFHVDNDEITDNN